MTKTAYIPLGAALFCGLLLTSTWTARAQPTHVIRQFDQGNRYYQDGRYEEALGAYEKVLEEGYASGALYYNMASAYYRTDELGEALRYYEKARPFMPENNQLRHNLRQVRSRLGDPPALSRPPFWQAARQWIAAQASPSVLFGVGWILYAGAAFLLIYRLWTGVRRPWHRRVVAGAFAVGGVLLLLAFATSAGGAVEPTRAIITEGKAALRADPNASDTSAVVPEGAMLKVLEHRREHVRIQLPDGTTGWLPTRTIGEI